MMNSKDFEILQFEKKLALITDFADRMATAAAYKSAEVDLVNKELGEANRRLNIQALSLKRKEDYCKLLFHRNRETEEKNKALQADCAELTARLQVVEKTIHLLNKKLAEANKFMVTWHDASKKPERWPVMVETCRPDKYNIFYRTIPDGTVRWCYVDELLKVIQ